MRVLRLLEQIRDYSDHLRAASHTGANAQESFEVFNGGLEGFNPYDESPLERLSGFDETCLEAVKVQLPVTAVTALMKLTFDEEHRHAVCILGSSGSREYFEIHFFKAFVSFRLGFFQYVH